MSEPVAKERSGRAVREREMDEIVRQDDLPGLEVAEDGDDAAQTPEEVAAEHKRLVEEANSRAETERQARLRAEEQARDATAKIQSSQVDAFTAQERAIASQVEAQTRLLEQAQANYRSARETGDIDTELKAVRALSGAENALSRLEDQKAFLAKAKAEFEARPTQPVQQDMASRQPQTYSQASQGWIDKHPEFNSNPYYKSVVLGAAQAAIQDGNMADTPAFFRFLDEAVARAFPPEPLANQTPGRQPPARRQPPASSMAAPPSRSAPSSSRNGDIDPAVIARQLGVTVQDLRDYSKVARMPFEKYVAEQAQIILEQSRGENAGLYRGGDA